MKPNDCQAKMARYEELCRLAEDLWAKEAACGKS